MVGRYCTNFELPVPYRIVYIVLPEAGLKYRWELMLSLVVGRLSYVQAIGEPLFLNCCG